MPREARTDQLQIRVSPPQKDAIRRQAKRAGMSMSDWVLSRVLPSIRERFQDLLAALSRSPRPGYVLAELNELLSRLTADEFTRAVAEPPPVSLVPYQENYVAAMLEQAAACKGVEAPAWTGEVEPLTEPVFGSALTSLRLHLLTHAPPPFRARNIFVDSSIGDRV
jgi:uncharacterized protein (DUF1778 family)